VELLLPYLAIAIFNVKLDHYGLKAFDYTWLLHIMFIISLVMVFTFKRAPVKTSTKQSVSFVFNYNLVIDISILFLLFSAIVGYFSGLGRWRYEEEGLSSNLSAENLFFALLPVFLDFLVFIKLFFKTNKFFFLNFVPPSVRDILILLALFFSASGIGSMVSVAIYIVCIIAPSFIDRFFFKKSGWSLLIIIRNILLIPIVIIVIIYSFIYGESIKVGLPINAVSEYVLTSEFSKQFVPYLVERFSPSLVSFFTSLDSYGETIALDKNAYNLKEVLDNFLFRLSKVTGGFLPFERPEAGSIMRLNYLQIINHAPREREGTSPGIIPGFYMVFPFPLAILFASLYLAFLIKMLNVFVRNMKMEISVLGILFLIKFLNNILASPIDFLLVFDPIVVSLLLFSLFTVKLIRNERSLSQ
jgi:hypothetical protein